jgi:hypothetical protein
MHRLAWAAIIMAVVLAGCGETEEEPPEEAAPPPPTAGEIAAEFKNVTRPLEQFIRPDAALPQQQALEAINNIRNLNQKHLSSVNGDDGRRIAGDDIEMMLRKAYESEAWVMVLVTYQMLNIVDPTAAESYERQQRYATVQVNRPRVTLTGIYVDEALKIPNLFCTIVLPASNERVEKQFRVGECWSAEVAGQEYEICLDEVVGTKKAIFTYTQTGEQFEVTR